MRNATETGFASLNPKTALRLRAAKNEQEEIETVLYIIHAHTSPLNQSTINSNSIGTKKWLPS